MDILDRYGGESTKARKEEILTMKQREHKGDEEGGERGRIDNVSIVLVYCVLYSILLLCYMFYC